MAQVPAQMAEAAIGFVHEDQRVGICHNGAIERLIFVSELIHANILKFGALSLRAATGGKRRMIAARETSAPAGSRRCGGPAGAMPAASTALGVAV